jgi:hypothetical protein
VNNSLQLNGYMTISKSKKFSVDKKDKILEATSNKEKVIRATLIDAEGNEVVLCGVLYKSKNGGLTARFNTKVHSFEVIEMDKVLQKKNHSDELAEEINQLVGDML